MSLMKVLYFAYTDIKGGAARGAYRLHRALLKAGIESKMLVRRKYSNDPTVEQYTVNISETKKEFNDCIARLIYPELRKQYSEVTSFNLRYTGIDEVINSSDADVVLMHWIGADTISIEELSRIDKPIIWRLADLWAVCGARHYVIDENDTRFITGYQDERSMFGDIDAFIWRRKKRFLSNMCFYFTGGSEWLMNEVKKSPLYPFSNTQAIPNGIETDIFLPVDKQCAKKILGLNDKKVILYGAIKAMTDYRKGYDLLQQSLKLLHKRGLHQDCQLLIFGNDECYIDEIEGFEATLVSEICNNKLLALLYSAANVMIVPSRVDVLPFTAIEALACATPVVVFDAAGMPELIDHKKQGYIAQAFNSEDLADGITWVIFHKQYGTLCKSARKRAVACFNVERQAQAYIDLMQKIIQTK